MNNRIILDDYQNIILTTSIVSYQEIPYNAFVKKTFILILLTHVLVDFLMGIWPIYKTIAMIDIAKAGIIMGVSGFIGEILQIAFGYLSDIGHRKRVLLFGLLASSAALILPFSTSFFPLLFTMVVVMLGSGSYHPAATGLASAMYKTKGRSILLFAAGGAFGLGMSQIVFAKSLQLFNGRAYPLLIPILFVAILWLFHRLPEHVSHKKRYSLRDLGIPFLTHRRSLLLLYTSQVLSYGVLLSFIFMLPDVLRYKHCSSWLCMGGGHMCFIFGSMLGMLGMGQVCDRIGYKRAIIAASTVGLVLIYSFLYLPLGGPIFTYFLLALLGICLYLVNPLIISWGNDLVPEHPSTVSALLMGFAWCLSNLIPMLAGILAKLFPHGAHLHGQALVSLFLLPSLICIVLLPSPRFGLQLKT